MSTASPGLAGDLLYSPVSMAGGEDKRQSQFGPSIWWGHFGLCRASVELRLPLVFTPVSVLTSAVDFEQSFWVAAAGNGGEAGCALQSRGL